MFINFSDLPNHQNLFLDYLYEFENVRKYFIKNFRNDADFEFTLKKISERDNYPRTEIGEIITNQYKDKSPSKLTEANIRNLKEGKAFAIFTGQQLGIYGGPLYTFYKIITAIKLANHLNEKYEQHQFVPVFWMAGDDHDFEEVSFVKILNPDNKIITVTYNDGKAIDVNRGPVGNLKFNSNIQKTLNDFFDNLRTTEFTETIKKFLNQSFTSGKTFTEAFGKMIFDLFDEYGLVIFDPTDKKVKNLLIPIFEKEILDYRIHTRELLEVSAELDDIYHAQVKIQPINIFIREKDGRYLLEPVDELFRLKGKRRKFNEEEILNRLYERPEDFSPNVMLRPICQDYLFPTAIYVGGPSEVSYFAQVMPLYDFFNIPQPIVYPRSSLTIIEKNIKKIIDKHNLNYIDIFIGEELLNKKILAEIGDLNLEALFEHSKKAIDLTIDRLREHLFAIDPNLKDSILKTREKIFSHLDVLKTKAEKAQEIQYQDSFRQIAKLRNAVFPNSELQERELNFFYFANKYGIDLLKLIFTELKINKFEHQIIEI